MGKFHKKLVGIFQGRFVIKKGDGIAWRGIADGGLHIKHSVITYHGEGWQQLGTGIPIIQYGKGGRIHPAVFVNSRLKINITVAGEIVTGPMVIYIGEAPAKASEQY